MTLIKLIAIVLAMMISLLKKVNSTYQIKTRLKNVAKEVVKNLACLRKANWWTASIQQDLVGIAYHAKDERGEYLYHSQNPLLLWRAETLFTKEPHTVNWIRGMKKGEVLYDVGANVGMYSIYAGKQGIKVFSFEPEASNYYILNKNIASNNLSQNVNAYCFALADKELLNVLKLTSFVPGSAHTTWGDNEAFKQTNDPTVFSQGCFSTTLDDLVYKHGLPAPDHLKIDVDGIEAKIVEGAKKLLQDPKLKTILIELNESMPEDQWVKKHIESSGFLAVAASEEVSALKDNMILRDYIFTRRS